MLEPIRLLIKLMEGEKVWGVKITGQVDFDLCFICHGVTDLLTNCDSTDYAGVLGYCNSTTSMYHQKVYSE
jgi:hypothetical protein